MKLPLFPKRPEIQDKWWHRCAEVLILGTTAIALLLGILIASEQEDKGIIFILPIAAYVLGLILYRTILYISFGHAPSKAYAELSPKRQSPSEDTKIEHNKIDKIAIHLKWCNVLFLSGIVILILGAMLKSDAVAAVGGFALLGVGYCMIVVELLVWKTKWKYFFIVSLFLGGAIGVIAFFVAYSDALKVVKKAGYSVGLLGPKEISFTGQKLHDVSQSVKTAPAKEKRPTPTAATKPRPNMFNQWYPKMDSAEAAKKAAAQGYIAAYIIAGITAVIALIALLSEQSVAGIDEWAMLDALLMALAGIGMQYYSRIAAVGAMALFLLGKVMMISEGELSTSAAVMAVIFFFCLLNGVRGIFAYRQFQYAHAQA